MVDVKIDSLIQVAKNYVNKANIDEDESGSINTDRELNRLLAGTGASSIEDLTRDNIHQKIVERDTEKIFTTFVATNNPDQARTNIDILEKCMNLVSDNYIKINTGFQIISNLIGQAAADVKELEDAIKKGNNSDAIYENFEHLLIIMETAMKQLYEMDNDFELINGQSFPPLKTQQVHISELISKVKIQQQKVKDGSVSPQNAAEELEKAVMQAMSALKDATELTKQYEEQEKEDFKLLNNLLELQKDSEIGTEEKRARSKDMLAALVDKASPMTRNLVIKKAEEQYNPADYPTTGMVAPKSGQPDEDGFIKLTMKPFGLVLMNPATGEVRSLNGSVIKPAR